MLRSSLLIITYMLFLFPYALAVQAAPVIGPPTAVAASVARYGKLELRVPVTGTVYTNPYDYAPASGGALLRATFTAPSGAVKTVDGYYAVEYGVSSYATGALAATGQSGWRVRFAPTETGTWSYSLTFQDASGVSVARTGTFAATATTDHGFVRRQAGKNYLRFDDNAPYFPVGENLAWYNGHGVGDFKTWLDQLGANKANMIRVWLCYWGMELEWKNVGYGGYNGLKSYAQAHAYELDWLLDYCAQKGIYAELCLSNHGQYQAGGGNAQWATNPYNAANGGPCASAQPWSFFSNTTAKTVYKNKLRYVVARYGYAKNLLNWELFNEQDLVDNYAASKSTIASWNNEMAAYLKSLDVNQHLVSNSYAMSNGDPAVWNLTSIDYTQTHLYRKQADLETPLAEASAALRAAHNKPYLTGEMGLEIDNGLTMGDDPNAIHFRNALWMSAFNGSLGAGLTWWWDEYIHPLAAKTYPVMKQVRTFFDANVNVVTNNYQPLTPELSTTTAGSMTIVPAFNSFPPPNYAATKAPANSFVISNGGTLTPSAASLGTMLFGAWHATVKNAPTFQVNYPAAGQFKVTVAQIGASATLVVKRNGVVVLTQVNPAAGSTYTLNVPAGASTITLDNTGNDWLQLGAVELTNYQARLVGQALRDGGRVVGYLRNRDYTWTWFRDHNQTAPAATGPGTLTVRSLTAGATYTLTYYSTTTGLATSTANYVASAAGVLTAPVPSLAWDATFVLKPAGSARPGAAITSTLEPTPAVAPRPTVAVAAWPNPATTTSPVRVALAEAVPGPVTYQLFDAVGGLRWTGTDAAALPAVREQEIPTAGLPAGQYVLRVTAPTAQGNTRLVVTP